MLNNQRVSVIDHATDETKNIQLTHGPCLYVHLHPFTTFCTSTQRNLSVVFRNCLESRNQFSSHTQRAWFSETNLAQVLGSKNTTRTETFRGQLLAGSPDRLFSYGKMWETHRKPHGFPREMISTSILVYNEFNYMVLYWKKKRSVGPTFTVAKLVYHLFNVGVYEGCH